MSSLFLGKHFVDPKKLHHKLPQKFADYFFGPHCICKDLYLIILAKIALVPFPK